MKDKKVCTWCEAKEKDCGCVEYINQRTGESDIPALNIMQEAIDEMKDRATQYEQPDGERSIKRTVEMFNALTGHNLTTEQGWKFMICLKLVRSESGKCRRDNYVDGAAYFALAGEEGSRGRIKK